MRANKSICILIAFISSLAFVFFGSLKQGFFLDEIYTYLYSNTKNLSTLSIDGLFSEDRVVSRDELADMIEVHDDDRFAAKSVYNNLTINSHPPLYYWLVNFISSIFPFSHSKWIGLGINLLEFILTICLLFQLTFCLFHSNSLSFICTCSYALSVFGQSTFIFIRMYSLLTLLTVLFAFLVLLLINGKKHWSLFCGLFLTTWAGLMTQYLFSIFSTLLIIFAIAYLVHKKERKQAIAVLAIFCIGVFMMAVSYPAAIAHLISPDPIMGTGTLKANFLSIKYWIPRILYVSCLVGYRLFFIVVLAILLFIQIIKTRKNISIHENTRTALVLIVPAFICFLIVSIISLYTADRYVYNIAPIALLTIPLFLDLLENKKTYKRFLLLPYICICLNFAYLIFQKPNWLYEEDSYKNELTSRNEDGKCLFFSVGKYAFCGSIIQLLYFDEVYLQNKSLTEKAVDYINSSTSNRLTVFIDTSPMGCSAIECNKILNDISEKTSFHSPRYLYNIDSNSVAIEFSR